MTTPLSCLNCQSLQCPIDSKSPPCQKISPQTISDAVNAKLKSIAGDFVSATIAIYKPKPENLSRCLSAVLPQVGEVVICGDEDTPWPPNGLPQNAKIKLVRINARNTGYGRKQNFAMRHSNGRFCWQINDDVFPNGDVLEKLMAHFKDPSVGAVTHLLMYPSGHIQFAGLGRPPGHVGFGHLDHKQLMSRFTGPVEQESFCGASVLIRRKAFYAAGGFSERYFCYSEDASCGLAMRRAGYKIIFDPSASGIHIEHESTGLMGDISTILAESHRVFHEEWGDYFLANRDSSCLGTFDYLMK